MRPGSFAPGPMQQLADLQQRLAALERLVTSGSGASSLFGVPSVRTMQGGFPVELTSAWGSTTGYSWKRLDLDGVALVDPAVQLTGDKAVTPDEDTSLASGMRGWLEPDRDATGWVFVASGAGSGSSSCTGDAFLSAFTEDDCFSVAVDGGAAQPATDPLVINEVEYTVAFDPAVPSLTLTPEVGSPIAGLKGCAACPCVTFVFNRADFYPEEEPAASVCDRLLSIRVCQGCCSMDGWDGPGWYCIRAAGTDDDCEPLELLEEDRCRTDIEICSGPYVDEAAANAVCGTTPAPAFGINCSESGAATVTAGVTYSAGPFTTPIVSPNLHYYKIPTTNGATVTIEATGTDASMETELNNAPPGVIGCLGPRGSGSGLSQSYSGTMVVDGFATIRVRFPSAVGSVSYTFKIT